MELVSKSDLLLYAMNVVKGPCRMHIEATESKVQGDHARRAQQAKRLHVIQVVISVRATLLHIRHFILFLSV